MAPKGEGLGDVNDCVAACRAVQARGEDLPESTKAKTMSSCSTAEGIAPEEPAKQECLAQDAFVVSGMAADPNNAPPSDRKSMFSFCSLWLMILFFSAAALASILVVCFTLNVFQGRQDTQSNHGNNSADRKDYYESLLEFVQLPLEPGSGQSHALEWMGFVDDPLMDYTAEEFWQRFALVVWYYDQGGPTLWGTMNGDPSAGWIHHGVGVHECDWEGVDCNEAQQVTGLRLGAVPGVTMAGASISTELGVLTNMEYLDFSNHRLVGKIPDEWDMLTNLSTLNLAQNKITSSIPHWIGYLENLQTLQLEGNQLSGSLPESLLSMSRLEVLHVQDNKDLKGLLHEFLPTLSNIVDLDISRTSIGGTLPEECSSFCEGLEVFQADSLPFLTGSIPSSIGDWKNLKRLVISQVSGITGVIPPELGLLSDLEVLQISLAPGLTGNIPSELGMATNLVTLELQWTNREGTLPTYLGSLTNLVTLHLEHNTGITGTLPTEFSQMTSLQYLTLQGTSITGAVDPEICALQLFVFEGDCKRGTELICDCCTQCEHNP